MLLSLQKQERRERRRRKEREEEKEEEEKEEEEEGREERRGERREEGRRESVRPLRLTRSMKMGWTLNPPHLVLLQVREQSPYLILILPYSHTVIPPRYYAYTSYI